MVVVVVVVPMDSAWRSAGGMARTKIGVAHVASVGEGLDPVVQDGEARVCMRAAARRKSERKLEGWKMGTWWAGETV